MRPLSALAGLLLVTTLSACTAGQPTPSPVVSTPATSPVASPTPTRAFVCVSPEVTVEPQGETTWKVRAVQVRETAADGSMSLVDMPGEEVTRGVTWADDEPWLTDPAVRAAVEEQVPSDLADGVRIVSDLLGQNPMPGIMLAYHGVHEQPVAVTVTCADGTTAHGTGATWTLSETGILDCEDRPTPKDDIPARVADEYCP